MTLLFHTAIHITAQTVMFIPTTIAYSLFFAPIAEELIFRRIIFKWLNTKLNFWIAASISSIIFAAGHGSLVGLLGYIVVGMMLCWIYHRKKNIGINIIVHGVLNFLVILQTSLHMIINIH
jgi:membrane protease YdiL (CAAX protease family)